MSSWVIGIDLGGTKIELGLVNPDNEIVARHRIPTLPKQGVKSVVKRIHQSVKKLEKFLPVDAKLEGLGICSPGPVDHETGTLLDPPNLAGLHNAPLRDLLQQTLGIPVALEHDAKAAALGEYHYGIGQDANSMVYIVVGTGVGAAIINNGELLRGQHNSAGEIGHITLDEQGEQCSCGRVGCVETFLSGPWLEKRYHQLVAHNDITIHDVTARDVSQLAMSGDPCAQQVMIQAGEALGKAVSMTTMMLNIDLFVIGGSVAKAGDLIIEPARRKLDDHTYGSVGCGVKIVASDLDTDGPILGCAWLARNLPEIDIIVETKTPSFTLSESERKTLEDTEGIVFDIQRFSLHDGPGIRTNVFLKGCALRCKWCSNPESQSPQPQLMLSAKKCIRCGQHEDACQDNWSSFVQNDETISKYSPRTQTCPTEAVRWIGERRRAGDVFEEIRRDIPFYGDSGGLTLTGGEPTFQPRMAEALARLAKAENIPVAMETAGHTRWKIFDRLLPYLDLILYDVKHIDPFKHKQHTDISNDLILANLNKLAENSAPVRVRVPLIPGFNTCDVDMHIIAQHLVTINGLEKSVGLLPYHTFGHAKYRALSRDYEWTDQSTLADDEISQCTKIFESYGFSVTIGS